ncbi:TetR/AcrR family transcriptional regulator [Aldersonia sp. NBC_00410]|uniref:TetR/AcrR family transcriptional regulator n=1 Tax=Aldersonia sp. NBC_00410 TaxID=2975954 RepID=UPI002257000A|nr:TetR/AcrR family transcriptional regulator [Aldersonia sp. NBC_00410]MCX5042058.1 TetR/AcrR family transcriptional regulator [Aldersonia sp. NBC_00410]
MDEVPRLGRPRSQATHDAILNAVRDILLTGGYAEVAMDRVASAAGVGKQSLYRRWPSKAPLVAEAVMAAYGQHGPLQLPDTGDIEADLRTWLQGQAVYLGSARNIALSRALAVATADNPLDADALYSQLADPNHDALVRRLQAAAQSGDIRADADLEAVADAIIGATVYRILTRVRTVEEISKRFDGLVDSLIGGLRA